MKLSDSKHKLTCFVIMTLFPFYKKMLQFSGWSCSYKNGALLARFQPVVLTPFVLICGCLLYRIFVKYAGNWRTQFNLCEMISLYLRGKAKRGSKRRANSMRWSYFSSEKGLFAAPYVPLRSSGSRYGRPSWFQRYWQGGRR